MDLIPYAQLARLRLADLAPPEVERRPLRTARWAGPRRNRAMRALLRPVVDDDHLSIRARPVDRRTRVPSNKLKRNGRGDHCNQRARETVHFRDFALSSSNQLSTTISLSDPLAATGRIIRKRWSSEDTAYCEPAGNE